MACTSAAMSNDNTGAVIVYVTVPSEEVGEKIAGMLVNPEARLAACVNIVSGTAVDSQSPSLVQEASEILHHCCICQGCSFTLGVMSGSAIRHAAFQMAIVMRALRKLSPEGWQNLHCRPEVYLLVG